MEKTKITPENLDENERIKNVENDISLLSPCLTSDNKSNGNEPRFGNGRFGGLRNPITVTGFPCLYSYLNRLRTQSGLPFEYLRKGSRFSPATETRVDAYEIKSVDGHIIMVINIDRHNTCNSERAPAGIRLKPMDELTVSELESLYYGVRESVLNFTDDDDASK